MVVVYLKEGVIWPSLAQVCPVAAVRGILTFGRRYARGLVLRYATQIADVDGLAVRNDSLPDLSRLIAGLRDGVSEGHKTYLRKAGGGTPLVVGFDREDCQEDWVASE